MSTYGKTDHLDGTAHRWELSSFVNQLYAGTALVSQDAIVICHACGSWKVMPAASEDTAGVHSAGGH